MKTIDIYGDNYFGKWDKTRTCCRAIVIKNDEMLLSYETLTDTWMTPGGGLEANETEKECCIREVAEETGYIINPSNCVLVINEYYEDYKFISKYFLGEVISTTTPHLTTREKKVKMEARWCDNNEIIKIFSTHNEYKEISEEKRGMYLREYMALKEIL